MDLGDLRSWGRHWNDAAMERIADMLPRRAPSRTGPWVRMRGRGRVGGGGMGGYGVPQGAHRKRLSKYGDRRGEEMSGRDGDDDTPGGVTRRLPNHRRKTTSEV